MESGGKQSNSGKLNEENATNEQQHQNQYLSAAAFCSLSSG